MPKLALIGTPEVSSSGVSKKTSRAKAPAGKLVSVKVSSFKTQLLSGLTHVKTLILGTGLVWFWEDVSAYSDPTQHYLLCVLALVAAVEVLTFKFSKIQ